MVRSKIKAMEQPITIAVKAPCDSPLEFEGAVVIGDGVTAKSQRLASEKKPGKEIKEQKTELLTRRGLVVAVIYPRTLRLFYMIIIKIFQVLLPAGHRPGGAARP